MEYIIEYPSNFLNNLFINYKELFNSFNLFLKKSKFINLKNIKNVFEFELTKILYKKFKIIVQVDHNKKTIFFNNSKKKTSISFDYSYTNKFFFSNFKINKKNLLISSNKIEKDIKTEILIIDFLEKSIYTNSYLNNYIVHFDEINYYFYQNTISRANRKTKPIVEENDFIKDHFEEIVNSILFENKEAYEDILFRNNLINDNNLILDKIKKHIF